jgi:hypothetical protein
MMRQTGTAFGVVSVGGRCGGSNAAMAHDFAIRARRASVYDRNWLRFSFVLRLFVFRKRLSMRSRIRFWDMRTGILRFYYMLNVGHRLNFKLLQLLNPNQKCRFNTLPPILLRKSMHKVIDNLVSNQGFEHFCLTFYMRFCITI